MSSPDRPPNQRQLAKAAGVSVATVSLALRGSPKITKSVRDHVARVAMEMGYRPNPMVNTLMQQVREGHVNRFNGAIAFFCHGRQEHGHLRPFYPAEWVKGVEDRVKPLGFNLDYFYLNRMDMDLAKVRRIVDNRGIRGIIVASIHALYDLSDFDFTGIAAVELGSRLDAPRLHRSDVLHPQVMECALDNLRKRGYQRIGLALWPDGDKRSNHCWSGNYLSWHYRRGETAIDPFLTDGHSILHDVSRFQQWLEIHRPDVIMQNYDGSHLLEVLKQLGYRVPQDIGFISLACYPSDPWAGVDQQRRLSGANAVNLIAEQLYHNESGLPDTPKNLLIPGIWHEGDTLRSR